MRLFMLGMPGSGKGTVSNLLMEFMGDTVAYFNVGQILRNRANLDDHIKQVHAAGGLVNSDKVLGIFDEALEKESFLVDGSPRKLNEAEYVLNHPLWKSRPGYLIHLDLSVDTARQRLVSRGRFDDKPEVMEKRFEEFFSNSMLSVEAFKKMGRLHTVNANQDPKAVCFDILKFVHEVGD